MPTSGPKDETVVKSILLKIELEGGKCPGVKCIMSDRGIGRLKARRVSHSVKANLEKLNQEEKDEV